ncbi:hypothetical protein ALC57_07375 [Trachymyrmex cornetzi]|uniref:Uncharacterized protein n=1 Tax=Trachymyrmex cornetzi TaxID=471704 RepID=A0A195E6J2_9HYME|nr:hypothetical protein ALC57_07375 [Trachymyrmex cornetzi]
MRFHHRHRANAAIRIPSQQYDVIHFPGCVNREEGGEGNPIRLHDPEANGTWEQRWRDGQIDGSRQPECHSEKRKTQRERERAREDEEGRREDECKSGEGARERCTTTKYDDAAVGTRLTPSKNDRRCLPCFLRASQFPTSLSPPGRVSSCCNQHNVSSFSLRYSGCSHLSHLIDLCTKSSEALLMLYTRQQLKRKGRARQAKIIYTIGTVIKCTEMMTFRFDVVIVPIATDLLQNPVSTAALQSERPMTGKRRGALNPVYKQWRFKLRIYLLMTSDTVRHMLYNLKKYISDRMNTGNTKIKFEEQYALIALLEYGISCVYLPNEQLFLVIHPPGHYGSSCKMENQDQNIDRSDRVEARRVHADDDT